MAVNMILLLLFGANMKFRHLSLTLATLVLASATGAAWAATPPAAPDNSKVTDLIKKLMS
jgi:membrane associated rhomboid family serine protease